MIEVSRRLLERRSFRLLASHHYFRRTDQPPVNMLFRTITFKAFHGALCLFVEHHISSLIHSKPMTGPDLPEPKFGYGDADQERDFWQYLRWMSDIAVDLLSGNVVRNRETALDAAYDFRDQGSAALQAFLESHFSHASTSFQKLQTTGKATRFWDAFATVGNGQRWDHWYFHLVLGDDPLPGYQNGVQYTKSDFGSKLGLP